jgi:hypothetical protein
MTELSIPLDILPHNLPSQLLSISDLLAFNLPQSAGKPLIFIIDEVYISNKSPNVSAENINSILSTPAPSPSLINKLVACLQSSLPLTAKSLACKEVASAKVKLFPLWLMTYWVEVNWILNIKKSWSLTNQSLQSLL